MVQPREALWKKKGGGGERYIGVLISLQSLNLSAHIFPFGFFLHSCSPRTPLYSTGEYLHSWPFGIVAQHQFSRSRQSGHVAWGGDSFCLFNRCGGGSTVASCQYHLQYYG